MIKYAKNALKKRGYQLQQMADEIRSLDVTTDGDEVTLTYRAAIDMIGSRDPDEPYPKLEDID